MSISCCDFNIPPTHLFARRGNSFELTMVVVACLQMAESLGSRSIGAFVALVSIWNFLGRMGSGYDLEILFI